MGKKLDDWISKMGYHFSVDYFRYPTSAKVGDILSFDIGIINCGVAPIYRNIPVKMRLFNKECCFEFETKIDIRTWLSGKKTEQFEITLPDEIPCDEYIIEIGMYTKAILIVYLCTDAVRNGSFY